MRKVAGLINFPPLALWREMFDVPGLEISLPAPSYVCLEIRPFPTCEFVILEYMSVIGKESGFYK